MTDDAAGQTAVIAFLAGRAERRIDTHGAIVFLQGGEALKIKRAVRFPYMDFSTLELRRRACLAELAVNRPHAPALYLGAVAITRDGSGRLAIGGDGDTVEWAVRMRRFPDEALASRIAERGAFDAGLATATADAVAAAHQSAPIAAGSDGAGRAAAVVEAVAAGLLAEQARLGGADCHRFADLCRSQLARQRGLLDRRAAAGRVRRCHGDLHLANIVVWEGRPTLFDALEFDEALATIDTLYDLAYLLMDLEVRGNRPAANVVLARYLWRLRQPIDVEGLAALPLLLALRAGIRAMVLAERAALQGEDGSDNGDGGVAARRYLAAALGFLAPSPPCLVAIGGLSGTGKSTLAAALAPRLGAPPGAWHLRSDAERKALHGLEETERLPPSAYTAGESARVYALLLEKAAAALAAGHAVVLDAAFLREAERADAHRLAADRGVPFHGLWLSAAPAQLMARVAARTGDASDATPEVVARQLELYSTPPDWQTIDAGDGAAETLRRALAVLPPPGPPAGGG